MNKINLLPDHIINKIAAGEVIERPFSVVKELVENSIDAGSTRIEVSFEGDGTKLIRIVDNGSGMSHDDALLSLERHATSKIKEVEDIECIATMGFRGEALSSIAAVSNLELLSCQQDSAVGGTSIYMSGGKIIAVKEVGMPQGTKITIRNLFFNTPARKKFLKSTKTEAGNIVNFINLTALAHKHIYFKLVQDGRIIVDFPATATIEERVSFFYGKSAFSEMIPFDFEAPTFKLFGFLSKPSFTRSSRTYQNIFVNRRIVQNKAIMYGINRGYERLIPGGRFPLAVVFIEINPDLLDVNIHPAKREVKFVNERQLVDCLANVIAKTLGIKAALPDIKFEQNSKINSADTEEVIFQCAEKEVLTNTEGEVNYLLEKESYDQAVLVDTFREPTNNSYYSKQEEFSEKKYFKVIGQLKKFYILVEDEEGLLIIDQHAAHERVLFEKVKPDYLNMKLASQKLLFPQTLELTVAEVDLVVENVDIFKKLGFEIRRFGEDVILVENIPEFIKNSNINDLIHDIIVNIFTGKDFKNTVKEKLAEQVIRRCCRLAVMADDKMSHLEMERLVEDIFKYAIPLSCPHGRPVGVRITMSELGRKFKR